MFLCSSKPQIIGLDSIHLQFKGRLYVPLQELLMKFYGLCQEKIKSDDLYVLKSALKFTAAQKPLVSKMIKGKKRTQKPI